MYKLVFSILILISVGNCFDSAAGTVETSYGSAKGGYSFNVHTFLGIPYAKPPVGDLRFKVFF